MSKNKSKCKPQDGLGRALINAQRKQNSGKKMVNNSLLHTTELDLSEINSRNVLSVTEESTIQKFLATAQLSEDQFETQHSNITIINENTSLGLPNEVEMAMIRAFQEKNTDSLKIPRRPPYNHHMSISEVNKQEQLSFIEWRRSLDEVEQNKAILLTPYEKNLELWRQLWRVVERSDIVVQVVDARNPLLFRSVDLERYVKEVSHNKLNMILINKADLLTPNQRQQWASYFGSINVHAVFFSALLQPEVQQNTLVVNNLNPGRVIQTNTNGDVSEPNNQDKNSSDKTDTVNVLLKNIQQLDVKVQESVKALEDLNICNQSTETTNLVNSGIILSRTELITLFRTIHKGPKVTNQLTTVGLVGYPNVGKSSTLKSLLRRNLAVSATPGKTKHFQSFYLSECEKKDLLFYDCPGLVMPSFVITKADMILNGILPIDNIKDFMSPVHFLTTMIPKHIFEFIYGIIFPDFGLGPDIITAEELLNAYAYNRGFMTANGQPDASRASRYILKDFINGKLLYCYAPPNIDQRDFHVFALKPKHAPKNQHLPLRMIRAVMPDKLETLQCENQFRKAVANVHTKGVLSTALLEKEKANGGKPWKITNKHKNKNKKEKLRRVFGYLDQH